MRILYWIPCSVALSVLAVVSPANAQRGGGPPGVQRDGPPVTVRGIAFDGLRGKPLTNALITLSGDPRNTTTDSRGRFQFDSVVPGVYTFAAHHATLDSLGFTGLTTRATITNGRDEIRIAVPSFAALWRAACGAAHVPQDSGFVYGTIRDATGRRPVANATVDVSWVRVVMVSRQHVMQRRWRTETRSDSTGSYSVCGVAPNEWLQVHAAVDSSASGWIDLPPSEMRVQRRDLLIGPVTASDTSRRGTVVGLVTDVSGAIFAEARVRLEGAAEVRSDAQGRFTISHVPAGTRQIEVSSVGIVPVVTAIDVTALDTVNVALRLGMPVALPGVKVIAGRSGHVLAAEFAERRRLATGYTMDSLEIANYPAFYAALRTAPSTTVRYDGGFLNIKMPSARGGTCTPEIRIDGIIAGPGHLLDLQPNEVAGMEVYPRPLTVPIQFVDANASMPECGMILVWTKYGFHTR